VSAKPKYATPRNPARRTHGAAIAKVAEALGKPLMPWQRLVADVATEIDEHGRFVYETVVVTVPRQSGKTTLVGAMQLHRALITPGAKCFYTAQTGKDARKRFSDLVDLVHESALKAVTHTRWSVGSESLSVPIQRSSINLFAPKQDALHGETPHLVTLDEIWVYDEVLGTALLEGAIRPAQLQLPGRRQVWMVSTAGTANSTFMRTWVDRGRAAAQGSPEHPTLAYFEWSGEISDDLENPKVIAGFHPAVGHNGLTAQDVINAMPESRAERYRGFGNVWLEASDPLFTEEEITAVTRDPAEVPSVRDLAVTYEIAPANACGIVMASWRDSDGAPCSRVLHTAPGTTWMHDFIVDLYQQWQPAVLGGDDGGPTRRLTDQLRRTLGDERVKTIGARDFGTACEGWVTMLRDQELRLDGSRIMALGLAHLVMKRVGDLTRFGRNESTGPIVAPIASAVGIWLWDHREPTPAEAPLIAS